MSMLLKKNSQRLLQDLHYIDAQDANETMPLKRYFRSIVSSCVSALCLQTTHGLSFYTLKGFSIHICLCFICPSLSMGSLIASIARLVFKFRFEEIQGDCSRALFASPRKRTCTHFYIPTEDIMMFRIERMPH